MGDPIFMVYMLEADSAQELQELVNDFLQKHFSQANMYVINYSHTHTNDGKFHYSCMICKNHGSSEIKR